MGNISHSKGGGEAGGEEKNMGKVRNDGRNTGSVSTSPNNGRVSHNVGLGDKNVKHEKLSDDTRSQRNGSTNQLNYAKEPSDFLVGKEGISISDKYIISSEQLGSGHYAVVRRCSNKETGELFAVKSLSKSRKDRVQRLLQEIEILKLVDHPSIIRLYEVYEDMRYIHLVMELCEGGELFDRILKKTETAEGHYSERDAAKIMKRILSGVEYCHNVHNICHRDLKPENFIFKTMDGSDDIKMIDFGLSEIEDKANNLMSTRVGTPYFMAPEIFDGKYIGKACDLWGLGVITFILLSGHPPFDGNTKKEIFSKVKDGNYCFSSPEWDDVSDQAKLFISQLLVKDPTKRTTASEAMKHSWLNDSHNLTYNSIKPRVQRAKNLNQNELNRRLRRFIGMNKLKRVALNIIAPQLSNAQIGSMKETFHKFDRSSNGNITLDDLHTALEDEGLYGLAEEVDMLLHRMDIDGSNTVDYGEFLAATMKRRLFEQDEHVRIAFEYFDHGNSGVISKNDLEEIFNNEEHILEIFDLVDVNHDGVIDYSEFRDMMLTRERCHNHPTTNRAAVG